VPLLSVVFGFEYVKAPERWAFAASELVTVIKFVDYSPTNTEKNRGVFRNVFRAVLRYFIAGYRKSPETVQVNRLGALLIHFIRFSLPITG